MEVEYRNKQNAIAYFESIGELPKDRDHYDYVLHHIDPSTYKSRDSRRILSWES